MPVSGCRTNDPLNTSMRLSWKFAASSSGPIELWSRASPLYTASAVCPTATAFVPAAPFHAERSPSSPAKMNSALAPVPGTVKAAVSLKTCPVGAPAGMLTTSGTIDTGALPLSPVYSVVTSAPLSETQTGVFGPRDMPQALTRLGSVSVATPGWSDTRFSWVNVPTPLLAPTGNANPPTNAALTAAAMRPRFLSIATPPQT